jgi:RNase H-fold protein (predicted Holliday junction resolvase)
MSSPSAMTQQKLEKDVAFLKGLLRKLVPEVLTVGFPYEIDGNKYYREDILDRLEK